MQQPIPTGMCSLLCRGEDIYKMVQIRSDRIRPQIGNARFLIGTFRMPGDGFRKMTTSLPRLYQEGYQLTPPKILVSEFAHSGTGPTNFYRCRSQTRGPRQLFRKNDHSGHRRKLKGLHLLAASGFRVLSQIHDPHQRGRLDWPWIIKVWPYN